MQIKKNYAILLSEYLVQHLKVDRPLLTDTIGFCSVPLVPVAVDAGLPRHAVAAVAAEPVEAALEH